MRRLRELPPSQDSRLTLIRGAQFAPSYEAPFLPALVSGSTYPTLQRSHTYPSASQELTTHTGNARRTPPRSSSVVTQRQHPMFSLLRCPPSRQGATSVLESTDLTHQQNNPTGSFAGGPRHRMPAPDHRSAAFDPTSSAHAETTAAARQDRIRSRLEALQVQIEHADIKRQRKFAAKLACKEQGRISYNAQAAQIGERRLKVLTDQGKRHYRVGGGLTNRPPQLVRVDSICQPRFESTHMNQATQAMVGRG